MPQIPEDMGFDSIGESFSMDRLITSINVPGNRKFPYLVTSMPSRPYRLRRTGLGAEETAVLPTGQEMTFLPGSGVPVMDFTQQEDPETYLEPRTPNRISQTDDQVQVVGPGMIVPIDPYRDYKRIKAVTPTPVMANAGEGVAITPEDFIFTAQTKEVKGPGLPREMQYQQVPAVERPGPEHSAELYRDEVEGQKQDYKKAMREYGQDEWAMDGRVGEDVDIADIGQAYPTGPNMYPGQGYPSTPGMTPPPVAPSGPVDWGKTATDVLSTGVKVLAQKYAPKSKAPAPMAPYNMPVFAANEMETGPSLNTILMIAGGGLAVLGVAVYLMRR